MKNLRTVLTIASISGLALIGILSFALKQANVNLNDKLDDFNYVIGTQTVGAKYKFTEETNLVETARQIRDMGSNILKFSMNPRYCTENYDLPRHPGIKSLKDLAIKEPSMREVLNMDFKYYHIWVYGFSQYTQEPDGEKIDTTQIKFIGGYSDQHANALYDELYELTSYFLEEFDGSGKVFYLGHWEGDWHLRWHYDRTKPVDPETLAGMIKWEKTRQLAIDDAKRDHPESDVELYNYIEINLVRKGIEEPGSITVANAILPEVNPDYVSYSSYDATNPYRTEEDLNFHLKESLDYIESFLVEKPGLPAGKRVWIGEYGNPALKYDDFQQDLRSRWTIRTGLEWGTPFILYWEMYNNEINANTNEHVGYWMINHQGDRQKIWHTHNEFYNESQRYIKGYFKKNNQMPTWDQFRNEALNFTSMTIVNKINH